MLLYVTVHIYHARKSTHDKYITCTEDRFSTEIHRSRRVELALSRMKHEMSPSIMPRTQKLRSLKLLSNPVDSRFPGAEILLIPYRMNVAVNLSWKILFIHLQ